MDGDHSRVYLFNGYSDGCYHRVTKAARVRLHSDLASYNFNDSRRCTVRCSLLLVDLATSALQWLQSWELLHSDSQNAFRSVRTACTLHTVLCLELYSLMLSYIRMAVICMLHMHTLARARPTMLYILLVLQFCGFAGSSV